MDGSVGLTTTWVQSEIYDLALVSAALKLIAAILENAVSTGVSASLQKQIWTLFCGDSCFRQKRNAAVSLHRADRARQEVRQKSGTVQFWKCNNLCCLKIYSTKRSNKYDLPYCLLFFLIAHWLRHLNQLLGLDSENERDSLRKAPSFAGCLLKLACLVYHSRGVAGCGVNLAAHNPTRSAWNEAALQLTPSK